MFKSLGNYIMESPMQETVYGTNSEDSHVMSEKVQSLASNIYQELERMIEKYDEDVVKELMPLVVNVLESLDSAVMDNQEHEVELELLREDNEQLVTQYEREKQLRKAAEQRLLEIEYSTDDDRRNLLAKVESLESIVRMLELKAKNSSDHATRLEEKDTEMKKEYATLHERYTELFKTHMDYMERTKILFGPEKLEALNNKTRSLHFPHIKSDITSFISPQEVNSKILNSPQELPSLISPNQSSDSNASLKSEIQEAAYSTIVTSPRRKSGSKRSMTERGQITDRITLSDRSTGTRDGWVDDLDANLNDATVTTPEMDEVEELDGFSFDLENTAIKSERRRPNTLYQELSFQDNDALGEMDEGADISVAGGFTHSGDYASSESEGDSEREPKVNDNFFGMGKEVENLISENNELLATKNALNVVKDDLIAKVDELTSEQEILREELKQYMSVKERLKQRVAELEEEIKKLKEAAEKSKSGKSDDEEELPMAQRKRFTRVEMARVLMERNQYKERLMELQEAVRWTEMIRASRSDSSLDTKRNKSSIWKFFSNLFNANEKPTRKAMPYVNVHYNAPTTNSGPALETMRRKRLGDRHRGLDILDSDLVSEKIQQQRARERREQYKQVRAHVRKEDGRLQAYGWSLPSKTSSVAKTSDCDSGAQVKPHVSSVPVPVPVFCRPLLEKEVGMKVWCAAGVDLNGGKPEQDNSNVTVVGSSLFYVTPEVGDEVTKLNNELKEYEKHRKEQSEMERNLSSFVWLCTSTHTTSKVTVIDANNPAEILDSFHVCSSHLLCIASIPGTKSSDYPANEEFLKLGKRECLDSSDTESGKVGDLFYVSIITEAACDSSASTPVNNDIENTKEYAQNITIAEEANFTGDDSSQLSLSHAQIIMNNPLTHKISECSQDSSLDMQNTDSKEKMSTVLPTMWLGSQAGHIYIHSSVTQWWRRINSVKLRDSVLSIVHMRGRVFAGLADGSVAIFHRASDGEWDLINFHLLDLGRPLYSVRCMTVVDKYVWCGYRNCIHVVDTESLAVVETFDAHPRKESQVRQMAWIGDGVWVTIRLDSTLRLYHAHTRQHLQDVDIEPYVSKMLGTGKLGFSFVRITALLVSCKRLWMGTGNGVIISVPLTEGKTHRATSDFSGRAPGGGVRVYSDTSDGLQRSSFIPYCSMAQAQLSFHGHRDAVKFFVAVPGIASANKGTAEQDGKTLHTEIKQSTVKDRQSQKPDSMLILSGGEGYIDFRIGDGEEDETLASLAVEGDERRPVAAAKGDRSHLIVWQVALSE